MNELTSYFSIQWNESLFWNKVKYVPFKPIKNLWNLLTLFNLIRLPHMTLAPYTGFMISKPNYNTPKLLFKKKNRNADNLLQSLWRLLWHPIKSVSLYRWRSESDFLTQPTLATVFVHCVKFGLAYTVKPNSLHRTHNSRFRNKCPASLFHSLLFEPLHI